MENKTFKIIGAGCVALLLVIGILSINQSMGINEVLEMQGRINEQASVKELYVCGDGSSNLAAVRLSQVYPGIEVKKIMSDVSTGADITMLSLLASNTAPDVYKDIASRAGRYAVPEFALDISKYMDLSNFYPAAIEQFRKGDGIYALTKAVRIIGMFINTDITGSIPENWTINDFLDICEKVKSKGKMPYVYFAANASSCEWLLGWFPAFGVDFFQNKDYSKTTIKSTGGEKVFAFLLDLFNRGYIPSESGVLSDDDVQAGFLNETYAMSGTYIGSFDAAIQSQVDQGVIKDKFNYEFRAFPSATGKKVSLVANFHIVVAHKSENEYRNKAAAYLAYQIASDQDLEVSGGQFPTVNNCTVTSDNIHWQRGKKITEENGLADIGFHLAAYGEIRGSLYPVLKKLFNNQITALEAVTLYEKAINAAIENAK